MNKLMLLVLAVLAIALNPWMGASQPVVWAAVVAAVTWFGVMVWHAAATSDPDVPVTYRSGRHLAAVA